jgi:hypothetical protein
LVAGDGVDMGVEDFVSDATNEDAIGIFHELGAVLIGVL